MCCFDAVPDDCAQRRSPLTRLGGLPSARNMTLRVKTLVAATLTGLAALAVAPASQAAVTPGGMRVVSVSSTTANLDWASVWPRDYYVAYLYDSRGVQLRRERSNGPTGNTSSHTWSNLTPCTSYQADATSVDTGAESSKSNRVYFKTTGCPEPTPSPTPPPSGGSTGWNGFSSPLSLPPAGWRPYMAGAAWNRGTAGSTVHPNSAMMVDYLRSAASGRMGNIAVPDDTGTAPVYWADADDPLYTIWCRQWVSSCEVNGIKARIPKGALPTSAYDRHLVSVQPDGTEVDLWESDVPSGVGGDLYVSHGGMTRIDGDSTGSNAVAAMTGAMAGQFRSASWSADRINHALQVVIPRDSGSFVYPAGKTGSSDPTTSPVPMGQWFKLQISDTELAAQPPWRRALYRAMRDYGLFVVDTGGGFSIQHENPRTFTSFGAQDPAWSWLRGQSGVDQWVNPSTGNLNMVAKTPSFPFDELVALNAPPRP